MKITQSIFFVTTATLSAVFLFQPEAHARCTDDIENFDKRLIGFEQSALEQNSSDPLIVQMKDGSYRDLRGEEARSLPIENWFGKGGDREKITAETEKARKAAEESREDECLTIMTNVNSQFDTLETSNRN